jgi:quinolinate synthetase A subunit
MSTPVDLEAEIVRLKRARNAVLLAHYYQEDDVQDVADFLGDSLQLAQEAKKTSADVIVFAGVHFMAETAKILNPERIVVVPDLEAGCSLADGCPADVKHGPASSNQDVSGKEDQPCVHGREETRLGDLKDCHAPPA